MEERVIGMRARYTRDDDAGAVIEYSLEDSDVFVTLTPAP